MTTVHPLYTLQVTMLIHPSVFAAMEVWQTNEMELGVSVLRLIPVRRLDQVGSSSPCLYNCHTICLARAHIWSISCFASPEAGAFAAGVLSREKGVMRILSERWGEGTK